MNHCTELFIVVKFFVGSRQIFFNFEVESLFWRGVGWGLDPDLLVCLSGPVRLKISSHSFRWEAQFHSCEIKLNAMHIVAIKTITNKAQICIFLGYFPFAFKKEVDWFSSWASLAWYSIFPNWIYFVVSKFQEENCSRSVPKYSLMRRTTVLCVAW